MVSIKWDTPRPDTSRTRFSENSQAGGSHSYALGLAASYELDLWGRIQSSRDAAVLDAQASGEDLRAAAARRQEQE